jgi:RNA polymerase sigma-70 factor (ECF subfamily)
VLIGARFHTKKAGQHATEAATGDSPSDALVARAGSDSGGREQDETDDAVERDLVHRARTGDRDAMEDLLRGQYHRVFAVCRRMTGNDTDAADAAQDSLLAIVRGLPRFDERSRFATWVYRIAVNCSIDELRRRARRRTVSLDDEGVSDTRLVSTEVLRGRGDPEAAADRVDIDSALRRLPFEFRAAVVLRDLCRLDYAEIAEVLEVPGGTVRSRIARGRSLLVQLLSPTGDES